MSFLEAADLAGRTAEWSSVLDVDSRQALALTAPALMVVDMQNDFLCEEGLLKVWGGPAIIPNVMRLVDAFHAAGRPVIFSRHIYQTPELDGGATARWWKVDNSSLLLREGTWHTELHQAIRPGPADQVLAKRRYSAFFGTDLELLLRTAGVRELVVTGVCTNICSEATAHDAFFRDFDVFMPIDANGATDEPAHVATLRNLSLSYGRLVVVDQVLNSVCNHLCSLHEGGER